MAPYRIVKIAAGQQHSVAVSAEGHLFTWGGGVFGIGHGDGKAKYVRQKIKIILFYCVGRDVMSPRLVSALSHIKISQISCGTYHTFCLAEEPEQLVFSFGHGEYGQQGRGDVAGEGGGEDRNALLPRPFELKNGAGKRMRHYVRRFL